MKSAFPHPPPNTQNPSGRFQTVMAWAGPLVVFIGGGLMLWLSWQRWADVLIDFGNQLYIPWRIAEGEVLYRDLFYVFGVLSPYIHALIFKLAGPGALYLSLFNIGLTIILTIVLYRMVNSISSPWTATLGALLFLVIHALGHHRYLANFNFIQPYSYDLTHGILLAFLTFAVFLEYIRFPTTKRLLAIGFLSGLTLLTKIEVMFALGLAGAAGLGIVFRFHRMDGRRIAMNLFTLSATFFLPATLVLCYFATLMPLSDAFSNLLLPIEYSLNPQVKNLPYYKLLMGTNALGRNLIFMFMYLMVFVLVVSGLVYINQKLDKSGRNDWRFGLPTAILIPLLAWYFFWSIPWKWILNPLPFIMIGIFIAIVWHIKSRSLSDKEHQKYIFLLVLTLFSLFLLSKIFFNTVIYHYGFALTFPASLMVIILVTDLLPDWIRRGNVSICFYTMATASLFAVYLYVMVYDSYLYYSKKVIPVGEGVDRFYEYAPNSRPHFGRPYMEPIVTRYLLEYMEENLEPDATVAVFPDAVMINYLTRHKDPIKGFLVNPLTWILIGGDTPLLEQLKANPPDYIVLVERQYPEWGMEHFGEDFAQTVYQWIIENYSREKKIGAVPFTKSGFGALVYKMKEHSNRSSS
ncbi:hypothetical protein ACTRW9_03365 [Nitrospina sp. 32_T5]|uniref:hypothetical protein n=1 Tax=unclassified Nitrospina TaxID=2638683 RepID=UPI003F9618C8